MKAVVLKSSKSRAKEAIVPRLNHPIFGNTFNKTEFIYSNLDEEYFFAMENVIGVCNWTSIVHLLKN